VPFHRQECFAGVASSETFPHADTAVSEVLAIPIYPGLTPEQQRYVVTSIAQAIS
jgi:dTDP-4-amino-4,6-dideoxygalactose transaminase